VRPRVTVVDYGLGNLFSVCRALEHVGAMVELADVPAKIEDASLLVLPGVGAYRDGMKGLQERGLVEPLRSYAGSGRPLLAICLGMQLLFEASEEFGVHEGLGLLPGRVVAIPPSRADGGSRKIPHIGWNALRVAESCSGWQGTPLEGLPAAAAVYFVHSYEARPADAADCLAEVEYEGIRLTAAVARGRLCGVQFHPEKSAHAGLGILHRFVTAK
jgi:glutamine amidotransferase